MGFENDVMTHKNFRDALLSISERNCKNEQGQKNIKKHREDPEDSGFSPGTSQLA
jgi:hypothetical protein